MGAGRSAQVPPVERAAVAVDATGTDGPGCTNEDIDGDGRILQMRIADPHGGWMPHPDDARLLIPVPVEGAPRRHCDATAR